MILCIVPDFSKLTEFMVSTYPGGEMGLTLKFSPLEEMRKVGTNHIENSLASQVSWLGRFA